MLEAEETLTNLPTPILDSGVLPPLVLRNRSKSRIRAALSSIAGIVLVLPVIAWTDKSRDPKIGFILLISALTLTTTIHELGHLFAGWMVGFRFSLINIGPFSLSLENGKLKAHIRREMLALGSAGMHVTQCDDCIVVYCSLLLEVLRQIYFQYQSQSFWSTVFFQVSARPGWGHWRLSLSFSP